MSLLLLFHGGVAVPPVQTTGGAPPWGREHPHTHHGDRVVDTRDPRDIRELDDLFPFPGILIV